MTDGIVVVDKPAGWTSHDVVARMRRLAGTRKVGHAGTLDPMATGVLVLGAGRATRLLGHLMLTEKAYAATIRFGATTTTDDAEGEITADHDVSALDRTSIVAAVGAFRGSIEQVPSSVSAIKVDGRRAYALAREGGDVQLDARTVQIDRFDVLDVRSTGQYVDADVEVECSSGTYIRALARDLGESLGVGGHLTALRRGRVGPFGLEDARTLDELAERLDVLDLATVARRSFPVHTLDADVAAMVRNGRALMDTALPTDGVVAMFDPAGEFLALYRQAGTSARAVAVFC